MAGRGAGFDVIVVLGGPDSTLERRTARGVHLFKAGRAERILLSGDGGRRRTEADVMCELALAAKVSRGRLMLVWIVVQVALLYAPFPLQRRLALGLYFPLVVLAVEGLAELRERGRR